MLRPQKHLLCNKVSPMRSESIAKIAQNLRKFFPAHYFDASCLNIIRVLEFFHNHNFFILEITDKNQMPYEYGLTQIRYDLGLVVMKIREDVYYDALLNDAKARFIIAHEIGHYFLHSAAIPEFAFSQTQSNHQKNEDAEWQANQFAKFLLVDFTYHEKYKNPLAITKNFGIHTSMAYEVYKEMNSMKEIFR